MRKILLCMTVLLVLLSGCVKPQPPVMLSSTFNPNDAAYVLNQGNNTIQGQSFLKTKGGDVKTCAGNKVSLVPVTEQSKEIMSKVYGNIEHGYAYYYPVFSNVGQGFNDYMKLEYCDANGNFTFDKVADGDYFVEAMVRWQVPQYSGYGWYMTNQGGLLMKRIKVSGGEIKKIYVVAD